ncbi:MAG TPA: hypothetical protein VKA57_04145 [Solirubrobacteraceae bacterium]|nr:hypothetical protein [Solirubrobacteraceae bacterium]
MTAPAEEAVRDAATDSVTFAFGDASAQLYGLARLGLSRSADGAPQGSAFALLFAGREPVAVLARGALPVADDAGWEALEVAGLRATVEAPLDRWSVGFDAPDGNGFALELAALGEPAELGADDPAGRLGGMAGYDQPCRVRGTVRAGGREQRFDGLGQRGHAWGDADWERIELARTVTAWTDERCAALTAIRPAGARDHAAEATWAALWEPEAEAGSGRARRQVVEIADGRLSTTYDADGHTRRAGLELWPADAEWPRRAAGEVLCGSSLDLGALRLDCSFFRWQLEGQAGVGRYDIVRRAA